MSADITGTELAWATNPDATAEQTLSEPEHRAYRNLSQIGRRAYANARTMGVSHNKAMGQASARMLRMGGM